MIYDRDNQRMVCKYYTIYYKTLKKTVHTLLLEILSFVLCSNLKSFNSWLYWGNILQKMQHNCTPFPEQAS